MLQAFLKRQHRHIFRQLEGVRRIFFKKRTDVLLLIAQVIEQPVVLFGSEDRRFHHQPPESDRARLLVGPLPFHLHQVPPILELGDIFRIGTHEIFAVGADFVEDFNGLGGREIIGLALDRIDQLHVSHHVQDAH